MIVSVRNAPTLSDVICDNNEFISNVLTYTNVIIVKPDSAYCLLLCLIVYDCFSTEHTDIARRHNNELIINTHRHITIVQPDIAE